MHVDQAMFGEDRAGHALLATTTSRSISLALASRLDLPDQPPPGVFWNGFISGFPFEDRYVLARTEPDGQAPRAGMVFSHALILPLEQMIEINNLRSFFAHLAFQRPKSINLVPLDIIADNFPAETSPALIPAANAFGVRGALPVVYLGSEGFDALVVSLWAAFWPEIRRRFAFRLSFSPQDLVETPRPALVCIPDNLANRWVDHRIVSTIDQPLLPGLATAALAGDPAGQTLLQFGRELGLLPATFSELLDLERAQQLAVADDDAFESRLAAVRVFVKLVPNAERGVEIKTQLRAALETAVKDMSSDEFLMLRNLDLASFPESQDFWIAVGTWLGAHRFPPTDDMALRTALRDATRTSSAIESWRFAVWEGIDAAARRHEPPLAAAFWRWISDDPDLIDILMDKLASHPELDVALADAAPRRLKGTVTDKVTCRMACTQWRHSHAAAAVAAFGAREAVRRQLRFDVDVANDSPLRRVLQRTRPEQLIAISTEFADPRLIALAAAAAGRKPTLLSRVDVATEAGQQIWAGALEINDKAWSGPAEPQDAIYRLLDAVLAGDPVISRLLLALSRSPLADLANYPNRSALWERLGDNTRRGFLATTADGWLTQLTQGAIRSVPEAELERSILEPARLDPFLENCASHDVTRGIQLFSTLPNVPENCFVVWLRRVFDDHQDLSTGEAEHLGQVVVTRRWSQALNMLVQQFKDTRSNLLPTLRICVSMLPIWDKWLLGISSLTAAEKWDLFRDVAVDLYSGGPDQDELWERAGGQNGDLEKVGTGRARWQAALRQMVRGRGVKPGNLLDIMCDDFPHNDQLRFLVEDREFGGSRW